MKRTPRRWPLALAVATAVTGAASITAGLLTVPDDRAATTVAAGAAPADRPVAVAIDDSSGTATIARPGKSGAVERVSGEQLKLAAYDKRAGKARLVEAAGKPKKTEVRKGDVIAAGRSKALPEGALVKVVDAREDAAGQVSVAPATLPDLLGDQKLTTTTPVPVGDVTVKPLTEGVQATVEKATGTAAPATQPPTEPTASVPAVTEPPVSQPPATPPVSPSADVSIPAPATSLPSSSPTPPAASASVAPPASPPVSPSTTAPAPTATAQTAPVTTPDGATLLPPAVVAPAPLAGAGTKERHNVGSEIKLDLNVPIGDYGFTGTAQGGPTLAGWVHLQPQVIFNYERAHWYSVAPSAAAIGIGGAYDYGWKVHAGLAGSVDTGRKPLRLPFAEVNVHTTLLVAGFPVVVDADLTYFYQISATGKITVDAEQKTTGELSLGVRYRKGEGWSQLPVATSTVTPGKQLEINGAAEAKATIGATFDVALYGSVGAGLEFAPYLRADAAAGTGTAPRWGVYAGFEAKGQLFAQFKILGITLLDKRLELPLLRKEWQLAGSKPAAPPAPSQGSAG
ncbi:hypothetical protein [Actinoplanes sp. NPDC051859]|uniref:hypothetical protein n=1 Tax=Actinoplanes sp. NPDC051859 TaxID=3363909 RepID=UPI00378E58CD